ncbi:hypothetical protein LOD99_10301 [Oopsacas minuta]|uniref:Fucosyltransferase n=1 Tax=Oopsacas minuta TaxID=111878 RepID=A0AAV7KIF1_9METZ|nr:hypothetical protein LOD99_10301 [Oopsacas minuta]
MIPEYYWGIHWSGNFTEMCGMPCILLENPSNPDGEFYMAMNNEDVRKAVNTYSDVSVRILGSKEPQHYYKLLKISYLNEHFEGTALLDWTSDVPWTLMPDMEYLQAIEMPKNPAPKATFVARNCNPMNNRMAYVKHIDDAIGVVAASSCYHNTDWPRCGDRECSKIEAIRPYKIHLAFENGDSTNFVTDKIYQAFEAGVLPVWMGTRDVATAVPKGSYIDVADFDTPKDLALYLIEVLADETLYQSYFEWKNKPFDKEFDDRFRVLWTDPFNCRMCRYIDAYKKGLEWDIVKQVAKNTEVQNEIIESGGEIGIFGFTTQQFYFIVSLFVIASILYFACRKRINRKFYLL